MIRLKILDTDWKIYLHSDDQFCSKYDESDAAFVLPDKHEIHFNAADVSRVVVTHELWHCYRASLLTSSAALDSDAEEEISAELFAVHGDKILRTARKLYKELKNESEE